MKLIFLTDAHLDERQVSGYGVSARSNWERLLESARAQQPDVLIIGGDIGLASSHEYFAHSLANFSQVRLLLGNHDHYDDVIHNLPHLARGRNSQSFKETLGQYMCVYLDSSPGEIDSRQIELLQKSIDGKTHVLVFIHHPVLPVHNYVDSHYPLKNRDQIREILTSGNATVTIFCGHYHMADVQRQGNITQYITPAASYQIVKATRNLIPDPTHFGYRVINLGEKIDTYCVILDQ